MADKAKSGSRGLRSGGEGVVVSASPRRLKAEEKHRQILACAFKVFSRKGFAAARIEDVAEEAGIGKGTVYLYFANKEALYLALFQETIDELFGRLDEAINDREPLAEVLPRLVSLYLEFFEQHRDRLAVFLQHLGGTQGEMAGLSKVFMDRIFRHETRFQRRVKNGDCKNYPARDLITGIAGLTNSFVHRWFLEGCSWSLKRKATLISDLILRGILLNS